MAAEELAAQRKRGEDVDRLRTELEKLRGEAKEMKEAFGKLESKVSPPKKSAPGGKAPSTRKPAYSRASAKKKAAKKRAVRGRSSR
jgi:hypothetical protein